MNAVLLTILGILGANGFERSFSSAVEEHKAGNYAAAAATYEQLIAEDIVHPAVFYNLGNAYYRVGQLGSAIANYERALELDPGFENARRNVAQCVTEAKRGLARSGPPVWQRSLLFWHYGAAPRTSKTLAIVFWFCFWGALAVRQWRRTPYAAHVVVVAGVLAVAFGGSVWAKSHPETLAVASAATVPVYYGTNEEDTPHFELFDGDRVVVDRLSDGWVRVVLADGKRGWTRSRNLTFLGPPYEASYAAEKAESFPTEEETP